MTRSSTRRRDADAEEKVKIAVTNADSDDESEEDKQERASDEEGSSEEDSEEEEEDNVKALFKGSEEDEEEDDSLDEEEQAETDNISPNKNAVLTGPEHCTFDLRNMTAMNSHQIPTSSLYMKKKEGGVSTCIPLEKGHGDLQINEDFLLQRASAGCSQLIAAIWQLPTETSDAGPLASLPGYDEIPIPRAMVCSDFLVTDGILSTHSSPILCHLLLTVFVAGSTPTKRRNKVGEICQSQRDPSQQREAIT